MFAQVLIYEDCSRGELYPVECEDRLCDVLETDTEVELDLENSYLTVPSTGQVYQLKPLGEVKTPLFKQLLSNSCISR